MLRIFFSFFFLATRLCIAADGNLQTYFQYGANSINELAQGNSNAIMSPSELAAWDDITKDLSKKNPVGAEVSRLYAYLYTAQRDAAYLSYNTHGTFIGSLGPISAKVLQLFFPTVPKVISDSYSENLAEVVFAKIKQRFDEENSEMREYPRAESDPYLIGLQTPYYGLKLASCKPWILNNPKQFAPPAPPPRNSSYWVEQSNIVKKAAEDCTQAQLQKSKYWAGETSTYSGDWLFLAYDYMLKHQVPFAQILCVRSVLAQAGVDVDIPLFYAKYTYAIKRPITVNQTIENHIVCPKHPSYPSGHSTWAPSCAIILSYYFPEGKERFFQLAEEAGNSRIWAGIHYPIDHQGGWILGNQLGNAIIHSPKICH